MSHHKIVEVEAFTHTWSGRKKSLNFAFDLADEPETNLFDVIKRKICRRKDGGDWLGVGINIHTQSLTLHAVIDPDTLEIDRVE